jgi:hypothetical protein
VVTDSSGSIIAGAKVIATRVETNIKNEGVSNETGNYVIAQLREGTYVVRVQAPGFQEFVVEGVILVARDVRRIDAALEVGSVQTSITVSGGATLIETETARLSDTKNAETLKSLPLNTRGMWAFLALSPNLLQAGAGSSTIRFAGSRTNQSNWAIDGVTMADGVTNTQIGPLANYIESFAEVKIDVANNSAEFGTIGQVTIISKSGTNNVHGNIFNYYSTPWFRARNPFALERIGGIRHQPGGSLGAPVYIPKLYDGRNKTFFFYSFETLRGSAINQLLNPSVPLPAWREGDFSGLPGGAAIFDPQGGAPFAGNLIPATRINPVSRNIQERFYPLPNYGPTDRLIAMNYREMRVRPLDPSTYWTTRLDHRISDKDTIMGRFTYHRLYNRPFEGNLPNIGQRFQRRDNYATALVHTRVLRPNLLNEFRWGFAFNHNPIEGPINGPQMARDLGITGLAPDLPNISGLYRVSFLGVGLSGIGQVDFTRPGFRNHLQDFQNHVSWFRGRHNMKAGVHLTRVAWDSMTAHANLFGAGVFSNRFSGAGRAMHGHPYADFLLGIPSNAMRAFPPLLVERNRWQYDFYFTNDIKVNSRLTLNIGLRYELHVPWRVNGNLTSLFDVDTGNIVIEDGASDRVSRLFPHAFVGIVEARDVGLPGRTLIRPDRNNFAPRIGLAYRPWGNRTVFRTGYGIFYDVAPRNPTQGGIPFVLHEPAYINPAVNPDVVFPRVFPAVGVAGPTTIGLPAAVNPGIIMPYSMQYSATIEHQRWDMAFRLSYIGTNTRHGEFAYDMNSPVPDTRPFVDKPRPFPRFPGISYFTNGAGHQYHGFTAEVERQMARGLYFQSSWVWARDIGDMERGESIENPFDRLRERAVSLDIPTHRYTGNMLYQLPFGRGKKWFSSAGRLANLLIGEWDVSTVYSFHSGQFLTPFWSGPDPTGTAFTTTRTPPIVTRRPDHFHDANLPAGQRHVTSWFDPSAFGPPQPGQFGSAAKGVIKGPKVTVWHLGLFKNFRIAEGWPLLRWELTATNAFNHSNWSNPLTNIVQLAEVGVIRGVGGVNGGATGDVPGPRHFRTGLRVEW